jgi:hypothetical protein
MSMAEKRWKKLVLAWALYAFLHLGLRWAPEWLFLLLGCPEESLFQHMKMGFFSYSLVSLGEVALSPALRNAGAVTARALSTVLYSYLVLILWLPVPILFGMWGSVGLEVAYSSVVLVVCLAVVLEVEERLEAAGPVRRSLVAATAVIYAASLLVFVVLAYQEPPLDVFEDPKGHQHGAREAPAATPTTRHSYSVSEVAT